MTLRVLHAPGIAGGNAAELARAERQLGLDSRCVAFDQNLVGYQVDEQVSPADGRLQFEWARWRWLWRAWREFDVIHFNFGQSFMPAYLPSSGQRSGYPGLVKSMYRWYARRLELRDLAFLKARGKAIFMTYQGDDARQGDYCRQHFEVSFVDRVGPGYYSEESDAAKRRRIDVVDRSADGIFALNPDLLHVLPRRARFLPYANVDLGAWRVAEASENRVPVIVHAPSHTAVKGSEVIVEAMQKLRNGGFRFEFVLIEGKPRAQARADYERADLCIDQLFAGWYGGLAVELMALGKPVVAYLRDDDLRFLPPGMRMELPIVRATPSDLFEVLKGLLEQPRHVWRALGARSRAFVEHWHDPLRIAGELRRCYHAATGTELSAGDA